MTKVIALSTLLALSALGMACGGATTPANNTAANNANAAKPANTTNAAPANAAPANTSSTTNSTNSTNAVSATKTEIGVASCDEYLAKMDEYLANPKVPEAVRTAQKDAKEKYLSSWKAAAATPEGKAGLETGCKAALDAMKSMPKF